MIRKLRNIIDPQLIIECNSESAVVLTPKAIRALCKKSINSNINVNILEEVYRRGCLSWNESFKGTKEQFAFDRVNSFIAGGFAIQVDKDLIETFETSEPQSKNKNKPSSRFDATTSATNIYRGDTPGQKRVKTIKKVVREQLNELFEKPLDYKKVHNTPHHQVYAFKAGGDDYSVHFHHHFGEVPDPKHKGHYGVLFGKGKHVETGDEGGHGKDAHKIFGTVKHIIHQHHKEHDVKSYSYGAEPKRAAIYKRMARGLGHKESPQHSGEFTIHTGEKE